MITNGAELVMELFRESKTLAQSDRERMPDTGIDLSELSNTDLIELLIECKEYKDHHENILQTFINKELSRRGLI